MRGLHTCGLVAQWVLRGTCGYCCCCGCAASRDMTVSGRCTARPPTSHRSALTPTFHLRPFYATHAVHAMQSSPCVLCWRNLTQAQWRVVAGEVGRRTIPPLNFVLSENCRKCKKMWEIFCPKMQRLELRTSSWRNLGAKLKFWALSLLRRKCLVWVRRSHVCDLLTF